MKLLGKYAVIILLFLNNFVLGNEIIYVKADATGKNDGTSWTDAYTDLQDALSRSVDSDTIWIAKGIYKPSNCEYCVVSDLEKNFQLKNKVAIYGGFDGTEHNLSQRNLSLLDSLKGFIVENDSWDKDTLVSLFSTTILSGEIGMSPFTDNSYNVILADDLEDTTIVDGLIIMDGISRNPGGGGGIVNNSSLILNHCIILNNQAQGNGAGLDISLSKVIINNCVFYNNLSEANGGGIFIVQSEVQINNCLFKNNESKEGGGGIYIWRFGSSLLISKCKFDNNKARNGGGFYNYVTGSSCRNCVNIQNCIFVNNRAHSNGGGLYNNVNNPSIKYCEFSRNVAFENGGGVYNRKSDALIDCTLFINNSAREGGGGVYNLEGEPDIIDCEFAHNRSSEGGGVNNFASIPRINSCDFEDNNSTIGGGMHNRNSNSIIINCTFTKDSASFGGGIANTRSSPLIDSCSFFNNYSRSSGAGLYNSNSNGIIQNCNFRGNEARNNGGGINNVVSAPQIINCNFSDNKAVNGSGIRNIRSNSIIINSSFQNNYAEKRGGGSYNSLGSPLFVKCYFISNKAAINEDDENFGGGGMYSSSGKTLVKQCIFYKNKSSNGGGIYLMRGDPEIQNCIITNNNASVNGGGILASNSNIRFFANSVIFNEAKISGGGMAFFSSQDSLFLKNCLIANNFAPNGTELFSDEKPIVSIGHNLVRDTLAARLAINSTDLLGNSSQPFEAVIDTTLRSFDKAKWLYALQSNSPVVGAGESIRSTEIIVDQRGYSRVVGSESDSIDIGAIENQHTFVLADLDQQFCFGENKLVLFDEIVIADSTGGAWISDSVKRDFILGFSEEVTIVPGDAKVIIEGPGFEETSWEINDERILVSYKKSYSTEGHFIRIQGLTIKTQETGIYYLRRTSSGDAFQAGNQVEDGINHARVVVFPTYQLSSVSPYNDDFESGIGVWQIDANSETPLWEWGIPSGEYITSDNYAIATDLDSAYLANIDSWVTSACFDIKSLERPGISFNKWSDTEEGLDGTVLQISSDRGKTWQTLGSTATGKNWYNSSNILSNPGGQMGSGFQYGWTGRDNGWQQAVHRLDDYKDKGLIQLRFAFRSIEFVNPTDSLEGFAIDDVFIGEIPSERAMLLEYFTDHKAPNEIEHIKFVDQNLLNVNLIPLHYSVDQSPFYDQNTMAPRARGLGYGITRSGHAVLNGNLFNDQVIDLRSSEIDTTTLVPELFTIQVEPSAPQSISITSHQNISDRVGVYVAIVENRVMYNGDSYDHVLRKFLPHPGGTIYSNWSAGDPKLLNPTWLVDGCLDKNTVSNYDNLSVIIFIQNLETKEVYLVKEEKIWEGILDPNLLCRRHVLSDQNLETIQVFPNPVAQEAFIKVPSGWNLTKLILTDLHGKKTLLTFEANAENKSRINMQDFSTGIYYLDAYMKDGSKHILKIIKL